MNKLSSAIKEIFTPGTPLCALAYAALGVILAALLLTIGFWRTLFIAVFAALATSAMRCALPSTVPSRPRISPWISSRIRRTKRISPNNRA